MSLEWRDVSGRVWVTKNGRVVEQMQMTLDDFY